MLISRFFSLYAIPLGWLLSYFSYSAISLPESLAGTFVGFAILWIIAPVSTWRTGMQGMGEGDPELLAFIGSFLGPVGCWLSLFIGATIGSLIGISIIALGKGSRTLKIPFGPFLAAGALATVLFEKWIYFLLLLIIVLR